MAAPRHARERGPVLCEYFITCRRIAGGWVDHPVAGVVPTCAGCAQIADLERCSDLTLGPLPRQPAVAEVRLTNPSKD